MGVGVDGGFCVILLLATIALAEPIVLPLVPLRVVVLGWRPSQSAAWQARMRGARFDERDVFPN